MKLKAAAFVPQKVMEALNSSDLAKEVREQVFIGILGLDNPGCAEAYIQESDVMIDSGAGYGVELRLTGVSITEERATKDYDDAVAKLEEIYGHHIEQNLDKDEEVQLFVSIMTDQAPFGRDSNLIEGEPFTVPQGRKFD